MPPLAVMYAARSASGCTSAAELTLTILPTATGRDHAPGRRPAAPHVAEQVGGEKVGPVLLGRLEKRLHEQACRVVDPDVEPAEAVDRRRRGPLELGGQARVADEVHRSAARLGDRGRGLGAVVEREPHDVGARPGNGDRDRLADAARGAGDDRAAAAEIER